MLSELLKKKKKGLDMSDGEKKAKMHVLKQISDMAGEAMGDDIKSMKKVSVLAPDDKGLEEGLKKAKEIVDSHGEDHADEEESMDGDEHEEEQEAPAERPRYSEHGKLPSIKDEDDEDAENEEMSDEELDAQMAKLKAEKAKRSMR